MFIAVVAAALEQANSVEDALGQPQAPANECQARDLRPLARALQMPRFAGLDAVAKTGQPVFDLPPKAERLGRRAPRERQIVAITRITRRMNGGALHDGCHGGTFGTKPGERHSTFASSISGAKGRNKQRG